MSFSGQVIGAGGSSRNKVNVRNGRLQTDQTDVGQGLRWIQAALPGLAVGLDTVPFVEADGKFGINRNVVSGIVQQTVWTVGGVYPYQTGQHQLELVSDDPTDSGAGDGARTIVIEGLAGVGRLAVEETVTLNGVTPVLTTRTDWVRTNRIYNLTAGIGSVNAGTINCQVSGGGDIQAQIPPINGQSQQAIYSVPGNRVAALVSWFVHLSNAGTTDEIELGFFTRDTVVTDAAFRVRAELALRGSGSSASGGPLTIPLVLGLQGMDMEVRILEAGGPNLTVTSSFAVALVDTAILP